MYSPAPAVASRCRASKPKEPVWCRLGSGWYMQSSVCATPQALVAAAVCASAKQSMCTIARPTRGLLQWQLGGAGRLVEGLGGQPMWLPQGAGCSAAVVASAVRGGVGRVDRGMPRPCQPLHVPSCQQCRSRRVGGWQLSRRVPHVPAARCVCVASASKEASPCPDLWGGGGGAADGVVVCLPFCHNAGGRGPGQGLWRLLQAVRCPGVCCSDAPETPTRDPVWQVAGT